MVRIVYSEEGTSKRRNEMQTWIHFGDFLDNCEGLLLKLHNYYSYYDGAFAEHKTGYTVQDVLVFFTGANRIPPLGFPLTPTAYMPTLGLKK